MEVVGLKAEYVTARTNCKRVIRNYSWKSGRRDLLVDTVYVVVVRLDHSHSFIDTLDNHSTASGPAWCRLCRPPGNAVSGHSSTMCLVVWWLSPQGQAGDAIMPHRWSDLANLVTIQCDKLTSR